MQGMGDGNTGNRGGNAGNQGWQCGESEGMRGIGVRMRGMELKKKTKEKFIKILICYKWTDYRWINWLSLNIIGISDRIEWKRMKKLYRIIFCSYGYGLA